MKRLMTATAVTALTATAALASVALEDVDLNGDSFLSMEEAKSIYPDLSVVSFRDIDLNGDNRISAEEINTVEAQTVLDQFTPSEVSANRIVLDDDADGFISLEDMRRGYPMFSALDFEDVDTNDDNRVSYEEIYAPEAQDLIARYALMTVVDIAEIDTNGDDFADFEELVATYPGLPTGEFEEIDLNDDNRVSSDELYKLEAQDIVSRYES